MEKEKKNRHLNRQKGNQNIQRSLTVQEGIAWGLAKGRQRIDALQSVD